MANRLDLDVPKTISHLTREEYNELVGWLYDATARQIDLMCQMLTPQPEDKALEIRTEIAGVTKLVANTIRERLANQPTVALLSLMVDLSKYKQAFPSKMTAAQARVLSASGMMNEMLRGTGL